MPMEATALIGTLGGIGEIAKQVFNNNEDAKNTSRTSTGSVPSSE
jgi:hypothetical protein